jgi:hypothetical protein
MVTPYVVLSVEEIHREEEVERGAQRTLSTGRAMLMLHDDRWLIAYRPTGLMSPHAPVEVLAVHEEPLVEQADPLDHRRLIRARAAPNPLVA